MKDDIMLELARASLHSFKRLDKINDAIAEKDWDKLFQAFDQRDEFVDYADAMIKRLKK